MTELNFWLQGTIWPDILESEKGIKAHHNAGGLPEDMKFDLVEPVKILFKDEVRVVGEALGLPSNMVYRQPFPGPGLGVRCPGAITRDRLEAVREADAILREEFAKNGLEGKVWQYFTVVPDFKSTGIRDGQRTFEWPVIIRAVNTTDAMTAEVEDIPFELMKHLVARITSEVKGVNRGSLMISHPSLLPPSSTSDTNRPAGTEKHCICSSVPYSLPVSDSRQICPG